MSYEDERNKLIPEASAFADVQVPKIWNNQQTRRVSDTRNPLWGRWFINEMDRLAVVNGLQDVRYHREITI